MRKVLLLLAVGLLYTSCQDEQPTTIPTHAPLDSLEGKTGLDRLVFIRDYYLQTGQVGRAKTSQQFIDEYLKRQ